MKNAHARPCMPCESGVGSRDMSVTLHIAGINLVADFGTMAQFDTLGYQALFFYLSIYSIAKHDMACDMLAIDQYAHQHRDLNKW